MDDRTPDSDAGRDADIAARLARDPESRNAQLDSALDESMDASDPPSTTQPVHRDNDAPPTGNAKAASDHSATHAEETERQQDA